MKKIYFLSALFALTMYNTAISATIHANLKQTIESNKEILENNIQRAKNKIRRNDHKIKSLSDSARAVLEMHPILSPKYILREFLNEDLDANLRGIKVLQDSYDYLNSLGVKANELRASEEDIVKFIDNANDMVSRVHSNEDALSRGLFMR